MIKKLNKNRVKRERQMPSFYLDKSTSDYLKMSMQLWDIEFDLKEMKDQIWIHVLRLRFAIANTNSFEIKTQLRFQEKIVLEHIANIEKLKEDNEHARERNYRKQYGNDFVI